MRKTIITVLIILSTFTSVYSQIGFGFDVTNIYSYNVNNGRQSDYMVYESSCIFNITDSLFIHKVSDLSLIQIYKITDYEYTEDDDAIYHNFTVRSYTSGKTYHYMVVHYDINDETFIDLGDDGTYTTGIIMEVSKSYVLKK